MATTPSFTKSKNRLIINLKKITETQHKALEEGGFLEHDDFEELLTESYTCEEAIALSHERIDKEWKEI